jgi:hypothetical protein
VALDGVHQLLDLLAGGGAGAAGVPVSGAQHPLDQPHRVLPLQPPQLAPIAFGIEGRGQGLAAGDDQPGLAYPEQAVAQGEDGFKLLLGLPRQGLRDLLGQVGRRQHALHVVQQQQGRLLAQHPLKRLGRSVRIAGAIDLGGEAGPHQLVAEPVEQGLGAVPFQPFQGNEGGAPQLLGADQPAGELGGERRLALAPLAAQQGVAGAALRPQQSLQDEQLPAAAHEAGLRRRRQVAEPGGEGALECLPRLPGGGGGEQPGVRLFLEQHGHEPVLESQRPDAEHAAAQAVVRQVPLAGEHGIAHPPARGQGLVEGRHEAPGGLHQHAVAHGDHGGHADLEQLRGDGFGGLLGLGALAGLEEHQRDAVIAQQGAELVGEDGVVAAPFEPGAVLRPLEAEAAEADPAVIDPVAVEVHHLVGPLLGAGTLERLTQGRQGG